jgi:hypothetical protein
MSSAEVESHSITVGTMLHQPPRRSPAMRRNTVRAILLAATLVSCAASHEGSPLTFKQADVPREPTPSSNWSLPADRAEEILRSAPYEIRTVQGAGAGVTGARKADVLFEFAEHEEDEVYLWAMDDGVSLKAKPFPSPKLDGWNNNPRKEIAAYELQKIFLEPRDYVVPTTIARCIPVKDQLPDRPKVPQTLEGTDCVLFVLSLWLKNVTVPDEFYDEARFLSDPAYAYAYATFNILTYLSDHLDNRKGNFLVSKDDRFPRAYAIDNGIAFGSWIYNWFIPSSYAWRKIVVPAVPRSAVDRLREIQRADLDHLAALAEFHKNEDGHFDAVPPGTSLDSDRRVNISGDVVQIGLTKSELDDVWERIEELIERVDEGDLAVF